jgi:hypothetical protein
MLRRTSIFRRPRAVRYFGGSIGSDDNESSSTQSKTTSKIASMLGDNAQHLHAIGIAAGGSVVLYGISTMMFDLASTFMGLTPAVSLKYGFGFGMLSTGGAAAVVYKADRAINPKPEVAFVRGLALVANDSNVTSLLGGSVSQTSSDIKAYKSRAGSFGVVNGSLLWKAPRVEALFTANGSHGGQINALVIMEQQFFSPPQIEFVGVDILSESHTNKHMKRTRLVVKEVDPSSEETHFAIMDKHILDIEKVKRS